MQNLNKKQMLDKNWFIASSKEVKGNGKAFSSAKFKPKSMPKGRPGGQPNGWYPAKMPSTVMAALQDNKVYPDPYFGENLSKIPKERFQCPWWYCTQFKAPADFSGKNIWLCFDGIVYSADIWLNGKLISGRKDVEGVYRHFKFNVTKHIIPGEKNYLAVQVYPAVVPNEVDFSVSFCDWNPKPPDESLGLWHDVYLEATGPVTLRHPGVVTDLELPSLEKAKLTVSCELGNADTKNPVTGVLSGRIENREFSQEVTLAPGETRIVEFAPDKFQQLNIPNPRVWWPHSVGEQPLYGLELEFSAEGGEISDSKKTRFGIRTVSSYLNKEGYRVFTINGKNILIRGGGYTDDLFLRHSSKRNMAIVEYAKSMNLNTLRFEGIWGNDELYDLCDEQGILLMVGWTCAWEWARDWKNNDPFGCIKTGHAMDLVAEYWKDTILRLRNHPGIFVWLYGSDKPPRPALEKKYVDILDKYDRTRPVISCAKQIETELSGSTGVKMRGPYDYAPPFYYYFNTLKGGAYSFGTEMGPGAVIPRLETIEKMFPEDKVWPVNDTWQQHSTSYGRRIKLNDVMNTSIAAEMQYGRFAERADLFCKRTQLLGYDGARAMFEAWARNKYLSTGVIAWMFNSAWPSVCWQLFPSDFLAGGAFFGTQKGCEPLHVQYSYDDNSVCVVNSFYKGFKNLKVSAIAYDLKLSERYSNASFVEVPEDSTIKAFTIEFPKDLGASCFFLKLELKDANAADDLVSSNFYALSGNCVPGILVDQAFMTAIANDSG